MKYESFRVLQLRSLGLAFHIDVAIRGRKSSNELRHLTGQP
jgi:hypothetical protein